MLKKALTVFILPLLFLLDLSDAGSANLVAQKQKSPDEATGTLQKMIVESGTVTMELDLNRLNGIHPAAAGAVRVQFAVAADSFFPILVFNADQHRDRWPWFRKMPPRFRGHWVNRSTG